MIPRTLAEYVPRLRKADDDIWRMRIVLHEFGLRWDDTPVDERLELVERVPESINAPWDAFLAAYVEHRCYHDGTPDWVFAADRYLDGFWFRPPPGMEGFQGGGHGPRPRHIRSTRHPRRRTRSDGGLMDRMGRQELLAALGEVAEILRARRQTARIYVV
jgi:hypothetical protein